MKNFGMGVNFEEEDPDKPLGTLKRAHVAIPFNEQACRFFNKARASLWKHATLISSSIPEPAEA